MKNYYIMKCDLNDINISVWAFIKTIMMTISLENFGTV